MARRAELDAYARQREAGSAGTAGAGYRTEPAAPTKAADAAKEATDAR
jgi:hypothetical protein